MQFGFKNREIYFKDSKGHEMLVYEDDEPEYWYY